MLALSNTPGEIVLERQTLFCKAVEQSAWQFCSLLRAYKPGKQQMKKVGMPIVTIGFPVSLLEGVVELATEKGFQVSYEQDGQIVRIKTHVTALPSGETFDAWKAAIELTGTVKKAPELPLPPPPAPIVEMDANPYARIIARLISFSVANATPLETMQFVVELQNAI